MYTFKVEPMGAVRQTRADAWRDRPAVLRYRVFKDLLRYEARRLKFELKDELNIIFYLTMPKSWSNKKRFKFDSIIHQQKPDIDNLVKGFMDSLTDDDASIWSISAKKYWAQTGRIEVV